MKVVLIGAGAMGYLLQQQLQSNFQVQFLPKAMTTPEKLPQSYTFTDIHGAVQTFPLRYIKVAQINDADVIICALKAYQIATAIAYIKPYLNPACPLILQHNGMGVYQQIRQLLPSTQPVGLMLSTQGARRLNTSHVQHSGKGHWQLGNYQNLSASHQSIDRLLRHLHDSAWYEEIRTMQWTKLAINCVINPLTAIDDALNGELANPGYHGVVEKLLREVIIQAGVAGVRLNLDDLQKTLHQVIKQTAQNSSSMREDILASRLTEVDYINGYIVQCAATANVEAPQNKRCWDKVKRLEQPAKQG